ncbi:ABC transporter permease [uncultured Sulfitobacter sp.]|uniref:ABC transporter permease n=1 Tax=uncultured Sulfitobacter sp. TaxID=191468 RepID=UPI0025963001|nr:ABC transporter permease [uncultured Sulfitobacter sp.]
MFMLFSFTVPNFLSVSNLENVFRISSILTLAALGQAIVIILAGVEFSIGSAVALCSIVTVFSVQSQNVPVAFAAGFATVLAIGAVNGTLVAFARLPPFLATLGMLILVHGIASVAVGGLPIEAPVSEAFYWMGRAHVLGVPVPIWFAATGCILHFVILSKSKMGREFYLVGTNEHAADLAGISVRKTKFLGYVLAAGFVGVSGLILTSRVASGQPNLIPNLPFEAISACAVGGISLVGGKGTTVQVLIGVLIISFLNNAIVLLNFPAAYQLAALGGVIVIAVLIQNGASGLNGRFTLGLHIPGSKEKGQTQ